MDDECNQCKKLRIYMGGHHRPCQSSVHALSCSERPEIVVCARPPDAASLLDAVEEAEVGFEGPGEVIEEGGLSILRGIRVLAPCNDLVPAVGLV